MADNATGLTVPLDAPPAPAAGAGGEARAKAAARPRRTRAPNRSVGDDLPGGTTPNAGTAAVETSPVERAARTTPAAKTPAAKTSAVKTPAVKTPAARKSAVGKPVARKASAKAPAGQAAVETLVARTVAVATHAPKTAAAEEMAVETGSAHPAIVESLDPRNEPVLADVAMPDGAVVHQGRALPDTVSDTASDAPDATRATRAVAGTASASAARADAIDPAAAETLAVQIAGLVPTVVRPDYWEQACADLMKRDRILKKLIPQFGPVHLKARGDPFVTLARSIIGQQISVKAAQSVWERVLAACPDIVPAAVVALGYERLAACGLSRRKAEYILDLGQHFVGGALHVDRWAAMDDEDVIEELTRIRGIGRWTAEMFLIFNLMRPDVLPLDDLGLIKAISVNYFSGEPVTRSEAREVAANWEPWRTVATWYMWRSLEPVPVVY